jgi:PAS domain S-box-containing protein
MVDLYRKLRVLFPDMRTGKPCRSAKGTGVARTRIEPTGRESPFDEHELIVSKTDAKGRITYANDVFQRVSGYPAKQLLGQPHSIIRHPDMPRSVFKLLWDTIEAKGEIFAYVVNLARNGDHYWVLAHVTPTFNTSGAIVGYHSNRRKAEAGKIAKIVPLYRRLLDEEQRGADRKVGLQNAHGFLLNELRTQGIGYDQFVLTL